MRRTHDHTPRCLIAAALVAWLATPAGGLPPDHRPARDDGPGETAATTTQAPDPAQRLREGSLIKDLPGTFVSAGERIAFYPSDQDTALPVLENQALERVAGMLEQAPGRVWSVSGTVTEFRGRNYLLISRAVVRPRHATSAEHAVQLTRPNRQPYDP